MVRRRGTLLLSAILWAIAGAAGCTVGPDYHLPKEATFNAPAAQGPFVGGQTNLTVAEGSLPPEWWHLYRDPNLDRLIAAAFAENTDLRIANANLERSAARVDLASSEGEPNVALDAGVERTLIPAEKYLSKARLPVLNVYALNLSATYELDLFGRIRRGVEAAKADDEAVAAARDWVRVSVAAEVTRAYVDVCATGDQLSVAHRSVDLQQESHAFTRRLQQAGRATQLDVTRSQVLVDQLRATIPALEAQRRNDLYRLATLSGRPPAEFEADLTRCVSVPPIDQPIPVGDGAALLKRRPDVRVAERELAASTAEIGVATASLYPRVVLGAAIGSTGLMNDFLRHPTDGWDIGPGISWELNQNGPRARIAGAEAAQKAQLAHFDGAVLGALRDVETALNVYTHDLERQKSLSAARDEAGSSVADARRLQSEGRSGALATLDAERTLESAEASLAALRSQIAQDQVALFLALGGGWESVAPGREPAESAAMSHAPAG